jgi:hypothetical protein
VQYYITYINGGISMKTLPNTLEFKKNATNFVITAAAVFAAAMLAFALAGPKSSPASAQSHSLPQAVTASADQCSVGGGAGGAQGAAGNVLGASAIMPHAAHVPTIPGGGSGSGNSTTTGSTNSNTGNTTTNSSNTSSNNNSGIGAQDLVDVNVGDVLSHDNVLNNSLDNNSVLNNNNVLSNNPVLNNNTVNALTSIL